jgi:hypothetical protein
MTEGVKAGRGQPLAALLKVHISFTCISTVAHFFLFPKMLLAMKLFLQENFYQIKL